MKEINHLLYSFEKYPYKGEKNFKGLRNKAIFPNLCSFSFNEINKVCIYKKRVSYYLKYF